MTPEKRAEHIAMRMGLRLDYGTITEEQLAVIAEEIAAAETCARDAEQERCEKIVTANPMMPPQAIIRAIRKGTECSPRASTPS